MPKIQKNNSNSGDRGKSYDFYAKRLGISTRTAKRKGKEVCQALLRERENEIKKELAAIQGHVTVVSSENVNKNIHISPLFNEEELTIETKKIGMKLLNACFKSMEREIESPELTIHQKLQIMVRISAMILGAK